MNASTLQENRLIKSILKYYPLIIAFVFTITFLATKEDMLGVSGDAHDIWHTITTWYSDDPYGSYVLYKGFESVYPYVWFYQLSISLNLDPWLFIKIFYATMFSLCCTILLPKIVEKLTNTESKNYQRLLLFFVCFLFWESAGALMFMIDLPSMFYFLSLVYAALSIKEYYNRVMYWTITGILLGLNLCASGQYTLPALAVAAYIVVEIIKLVKKEKQKIRPISLIAFIGTLGAIKLYNEYFLRVIVENFRNNGAWILSANDWLQCGFLRFQPYYRVGLGSFIYGNRGLLAIQDYFGDQWATYRESILAGGYPISAFEYLGIVFRYPLDFAATYLAKMFLTLSPDLGHLCFFPLLLTYTLLFITIYFTYKHCKNNNKKMNSKILIVLAFVFANIPSLVLVYESRYGMQIQGLIMAVALCTPLIWDELKKIITRIVNKDKCESYKINYSVIIAYVSFIMICFTIITLLYENSQTILFTLF